ncbi:MAG: glycosyltransferase [Clostridiales bacterium]
MNFNYKNAKGGFIIPHWNDNRLISKKYLLQTLDAIYNQTDQNFIVILVDDSSPSDVKKQLYKIKENYDERLFLFVKHKNEGAGATRNNGIMEAYKMNIPIILFNDQDDISHNKRLEIVRKEFCSNDNYNVVYSTFKVIDENSNLVDKKNIPEEIAEILNGHKQDIVEGENAWLKIGLNKNYTNLTSSTSVKTEVAMLYPFPEKETCEDTNTWFRYGAHKGEFKYNPSIPSLYRVNISKNSTSSREQFKKFYEWMVKLDSEGFIEAMKIAIENGSFHANGIKQRKILAGFYVKLGETLLIAKQYELALNQISKAKKIDSNETYKLLKKNKLDFFK